ncbi:uncharacterized protein K444DRAFT_16989 [Hyaloscypha bicolor E]|uniref:Uncharacterized protein n=1 Tax=Hyaloscypha bicolor E TaxID=1095630 RepID=A0A2J6TX19_9HELO|nr:uncharacterized protein K444DRAFT_16989 [Hyaloscypha bicolor E]PMD67498.1 hypothetical protein K444DRAFT_16989 [Hyaloscypha bicolor E]
MTPPMSVPENIRLNNTQDAENFGSAFTCTVALMSTGRRLQFSTRNYPLNGTSSLRSSAPRMYDDMFDKIHGPLMIVIDYWRPWYLQHLQMAFPDFPARSLRSFIERENASMLPLINENQELTCITEHISVDSYSPKPQGYGEIIQLGDRKACCRSVFTWATKFACSNPEDGRPTDYLSHAYMPRSRRLQPLIVLVSGPNAPIADRLKRYYFDSDPQHERWDRLAGDLDWIYLDTYFLFTKWEKVWAVVKRNLKAKVIERFYPSSSAPILQQTRELHEHTDTIMGLHEHLRIHEASLARFALQLGPTQLFTPRVRLKLLARVSHIQHLLSYYDMTASSLLAQQSNLINLGLSLETVSQGQAVARLNVLALVFLPLSFAA